MSGLVRSKRLCAASTALHAEGGQSSVEFVALAPLLAVIALAVAQLLAAGAVSELAEHAAGAAAVAILQETDPAAAARDAVPGWSRRRMTVRVVGRRVHVQMRPPSPIAAITKLLRADATASAGPATR
jgi:hypothetical protein